MLRAARTSLIGVLLIVLMIALGAGALSAASQKPAGANPQVKGDGVHYMGCLPSDTTGFQQMSVPESSTPLAASVNLSAQTPPIGNQGHQGSCTSWAVSYDYKSWSEKKKHPSNDLANPAYQFSPSFVYNQINGGKDKGSSFSDAFNLLQNEGDVSINSMPYNEYDYKTQPTNAQLAEALQYRIPKNCWRYLWVHNDPEPTSAVSPYKTPNDITQVKKWLASGKMLVMSIPIFKDFPDDSGNPARRYYDYNGTSVQAGGHAVTIVGYDDNINPSGSDADHRGGFLMANSWGSDWNGPNKGFVYLSYYFVKSYGDEAWVMNDSGSSFYFAEGTTRPNFAEYLCLGNPNSAAATANVTYVFPDGATKNSTYSVPANSRYTVNVNSEVGANKDVSIRIQSDADNLVAERPMYFNYNGVWTGGSDAVGATALNTNWYFAEGTTLSGFDEYITVLNPASKVANLAFHYMVEGHGVAPMTETVNPHSRATFSTREQLGSNLNESLYLSSDQAVVAERPMYFNYQGLAGNNWTGGHDVVGTNSPNTNWYFAEGTTRKNSTDGAFEQWLCLQNPGTSPITVNATYQLAAGQGNPINKSYTVPAKERLTVSVNREIGPDKDCSVHLNSTSNFIAERPMYFNYHNVWTGGHDVLGTNSSAKTWFFAEGTTRDNFNEWLCLQNPGSSTAHITITYYTTSGQAIKKNWTVSANSRLTVNVNQDAGANQDISAKVSSDNPVIVERPMYFNYNGWTGGHDVVGLTQ